MEATIGQKIRKALTLLEHAKAIGWGHVEEVPKSDQLYATIVEAFDEIDSADSALMDLSKAISPEPKA
ncbi:MAG TPA: hypothetical protein VGW77_00675 [Candidatus Binatia bacterium]|nr:hypothetical protein [Candidatus Binatia bacterium]